MMLRLLPLLCLCLLSARQLQAQSSLVMDPVSGSGSTKSESLTLFRATLFTPNFAPAFDSTTAPLAARVAVSYDERRGAPRWVRWGLVGAAAGAVTLPLIGSLASDSPARPARSAVAGAIGGFVIVGGSVAAWDALCGGDTRSRRAGLCGSR